MDFRRKDDMGRLVLLSLFFILVLGFPSASVQSAGGENPCPKLLLKSVVENHGKGQNTPGGFSRNRTLLEYLRIFPNELGEKIYSLGGNATILEAGSGEAIAAEQMLQSGIEGLVEDERELFRQQESKWELALDHSETLKKIGNKPMKDRPKIIAVSKEMERKLDVVPYHGKLELLTGRFFEDIPAAELGHPKLILDPIGVMSYTTHPSEVLRKYLEVLAPDGEIYLWMDGSRIEINYRREYTLDDGVRAMKNLNPTPANHFRWLVNLDGKREIYFFDWLLSLNQPGLEVKEMQTKMLLSVSRDHQRILRENRYTTFRIRKTGKAEIQIPELELVKVDPAMNPPGRTFKVVHPARVHP